MNQTTPAIVAQDAVRRLPRAALLLFCIAYVVPGFIGREPWKNADIAAFGHMFELARGAASWLAPTLAGQPPEFDALLPYWIGAWAIQIAPAWIPADFAVRIPFALLLALALAATWYAVYSLARSPQAQPVPFAFGGEAQPRDYARAIADGGLLALIASLGLAQLSHETTPALAQLAFTTLSFLGLAALPWRAPVAAACLLLGLPALALSGAVSMAVLFGAGALVLVWIERPPPAEAAPTSRAAQATIVAAALLITIGLATAMDLWRWRITPDALTRDWRSHGRLLLWFTWPAWPLAMWTLWRWRRQLGSRHVALPLWFALVAVGTTLATPSSDRSLLLSLPALAALAAFALPTFSRNAAALIDWFTLLFFTGCALVIWVVWFAIQTGVPPKPAANVARLAPGFEPSFSITAFAAALLATLAWAWLVRWRTGRHRLVIWKSLVLPAGGAALCWLLLMTLWLPVLDYARSYATVVRGVVRQLDQPGCIDVFGLGRGQIAALRYHGNLDVRLANRNGDCPWRLVALQAAAAAPVAMDMHGWQLVARVRRPVDPTEDVLLYRKAGSR
ncbi:hypothetical protein [Ramlibacter sp.]|uniref:hypothetical protein n=1 Tax=Ramlibacter sp. TaxID=1917967 RepID=UPI002C524405|nr:hypothetical protein [Ramlibacter sp.]HWI80555.1 hypothetical protein [Ramlibacter sp.]